jgi:hypothetical protein
MEMDTILTKKINFYATVNQIKNQTVLVGIGLFFSLFLFVSIVSAAGDQLTIGQAYFTLNDKEVMLFADIPDPVIEAQPDMISLSLDGTVMEKARISNFCRSEVPLTFLFLIDTKKTVYESEKNRPEEIIRAFRDFYFFQGHSKIAIMTYGDSTKVVLEPTSDPAAIEQAAVKIRFTSEDSSFPDALLEAVDYVNKISANDGSFKHIVLFTDGNGYDNRYITEADMTKLMQDSGISLFILKTHDTNAYYGDEAKEHAESPGWFATYSPELYPLSTEEPPEEGCWCDIQTNPNCTCDKMVATPVANIPESEINYNRLKRIAGASDGLAVSISESNRSAVLAKKMMDIVCSKNYITAEVPDSFSKPVDKPIEFTLYFFKEKSFLDGTSKSVYPTTIILSAQ